MNIKNPQAHRLAQELAALTGETLTEAVTAALRERLDRLIPAQNRDRQARYEAVMEIVRQSADAAARIPSSTEIGDLLYDERGLPK
jgi:antitoxin VapB